MKTASILRDQPETRRLKIHVVKLTVPGGSTPCWDVELHVADQVFTLGHGFPTPEKALTYARTFRLVKPN